MHSGGPVTSHQPQPGRNRWRVNFGGQGTSELPSSPLGLFKAAEAGFNPRGCAAPRLGGQDARVGPAPSRGCWLPWVAKTHPAEWSTASPPHSLTAKDTFGHLSPVTRWWPLSWWWPQLSRRVLASPTPANVGEQILPCRSSPGTLGHRVGCAWWRVQHLPGWQQCCPWPRATGCPQDTPNVTTRAMAESGGRGGEGGEVKP